MQFNMPPKRKITVSKRTAFWPYGACRLNCKSDSIYCVSCKQWFHTDCERLSSEDANLFRKAKLSYSCSNCFAYEFTGEYNYSQGLCRLVQVRKHFFILCYC